MKAEEAEIEKKEHLMAEQKHKMELDIKQLHTLQEDVVNEKKEISQE